MYPAQAGPDCLPQQIESGGDNAGSERDPTSRRLCYSNGNSFRSRQAIILEESLHNPSCVTVLANAARWRLEAGRPAP